MPVRNIKLFANNEIRRFTVESVNEVFKYESLVQKVAELYPNLEGVKLAWKDKDGDVVTLSNDDEFKDALNQTNGDVLNVYLMFVVDVAPKPTQTSTLDHQPPMETETSTPKEEVDPTLHVGISCDSCNGVVKGIRYKCLTCPNYDLCESCESTQRHLEHPMIRIASPTDKTWRKAFIANQFPFHPHAFRCNGQEAAGASANVQGEGKDGNCCSGPSNNPCGGDGANIVQMIKQGMAAFGIDPQKLQEMLATPTGPDPAKIQKALDDMLAMGFTNEDGWLENLLRQKNGDIHAVLDMLKPHGH